MHSWCFSVVDLLCQQCLFFSVRASVLNYGSYQIFILIFNIQCAYIFLFCLGMYTCVHKYIYVCVCTYMYCVCIYLCVCENGWIFVCVTV